MDWTGISEKFHKFITKYKYVALVLLIGIIMMMLPTNKDTKEPAIPKQSEPEEISVAQQLEEVLGTIAGVGAVKVLLTESSTAETVFQTDMSQSGTAGEGNLKEETVLVSDSTRNQSGLIRKVIPPVFMGAVIVCQGGDQPAIKLAVTQAVANATGLKTDRISVLKMK